MQRPKCAFEPREVFRASASLTCTFLARVHARRGKDSVLTRTRADVLAGYIKLFEPVLRDGTPPNALPAPCCSFAWVTRFRIPEDRPSFLPRVHHATTTTEISTGRSDAGGDAPFTISAPKILSRRRRKSRAPPVPFLVPDFGPELSTKCNFGGPYTDNIARKRPRSSPREKHRTRTSFACLLSRESERDYVSVLGTVARRSKSRFARSFGDEATLCLVVSSGEERNYRVISRVTILRSFRFSRLRTSKRIFFAINACVGIIDARSRCGSET